MLSSLEHLDAAADKPAPARAPAFRPRVPPRGGAARSRPSVPANETPTPTPTSTPAAVEPPLVSLSHEPAATPSSITAEPAVAPHRAEASTISRQQAAVQPRRQVHQAGASTTAVPPASTAEAGLASQATANISQAVEADERPSTSKAARGEEQQQQQQPPPKHTRIIRRSVVRRRGEQQETNAQDQASAQNLATMTLRQIIRKSAALDRELAKKDPKKPREDKDTAPAARTPAPPPPTTSVQAPQVQIIDGRIVVNEASLLMTAGAENAPVHGAFRRVEEGAPLLNSATYSNRTIPERWSAEDTEIFYQAMTHFGTDFTLIQRMLPGRTRRQCKAKYKAEELRNPKRVEAALTHTDPLDTAQYEEVLALITAQSSAARHSGQAAHSAPKE
eukprot:jgi/Chlat1/1493/Chrsp12S02027